MSAVLTLDAVSLTIGGARILRDVSATVAKGEMVGVIGPNGAGKSTLFNVISGITRPSSGRVTLAGDDVTGLSVQRRARAGLGRTFQTSSVFPGLPVLENVRLAAQSKLGNGASLFRRPGRADTATERARECLDEVGLPHAAGLLAGSLSHGDKRKLEIAMVIAVDPTVVLLDEPMAGVGSGDVAGLSDVIGQLHRSGRTVLMVEHHMEILLGLVDRVAVLNHGELLAFDEPEAVMSDPTVQAAYLGEPL